MSPQRILIPIGGVLLIALGYYYAGWSGVALSAGALVMWILLHFTRLMRVLQRAAQRPMGYLDSAVMLNVKLKPRMTLMHVIAMTRALGELRSVKDAQPEVYRWTDGTDSWVECTFVGGRLTSHVMYRPPAQEQAPERDPAASLPPPP
ncbi:MAG: glycerate kinase [Betaproteobacteria bacterium]